MMYNTLFNLFLILVAGPVAWSQNNQLVGLITYQNSGEPVGGVSVTPTEGASPTQTNDLGQFTLKFPEKFPGDIVRLVLVKNEYQIVGLDPMVVEIALRQEAGDIVRIVMVKKEEYEKREELYVKSIEKQLDEKNKEIQFLRSQLSENQVNDLERRGLTQKIGDLIEQIESLEKNKEELAKGLAQVDLDQASSFTRQALDDFKAGNLEKALSFMSDKKLDDFWNQVLEQEAKVNRAKRQGVENYMIKARLLAADGQNDNAYKIYIKAIQKDSINVYNLWELAYFCGERDRQKRAIKFYEQALTYASSENEKAHLLNNIGGQFKHNNDYDQAELSYLEALKIRKGLARANPEYYEQEVARTLNNLGLMYVDLNAYDQAEAAYLEALDIRKRLAKANSEHYEWEVAQTQNNLGLMYIDLNAYNQAAITLKDALEIYQRLAKINPKRYESELARTQNSLGNMFLKLNAYDQAEAAYQKVLEIYRQVAKNNPGRFELEVAGILNNLGIIYRHLNTYNKAEAAYLEALEIRKRLALTNPERFEPQVAQTQNNLGLMYTDLNAYDQAEAACKAALEIRKRLAKTNPERFEPAVAATQGRLGNIYRKLTDYNQAEVAYKAALKIYRRLAKTNPERFEPQVAAVQNNSGTMFRHLNAYDKAEEAYLEALEIYERLAKTNLERFKPAVAIIQANLGLMYVDLNAYDQAAVVLQEALGVNQQLAKVNPERFEPEVAGTQLNLGLMYTNLNLYDQAETAYLEALEINRRYALKQPNKYDIEVAHTAFLLASVKQKKQQRKEAIPLFQESLQLTDNYRQVPFANQLASIIIKTIGIEVADPTYVEYYKKTNVLVQKIEALATEEAKAELQKQVVEVWEEAHQQYPDNARINDFLSQAISDLSWYLLFVKDFEGSEIAARRGLKVDLTQRRIIANLANALLFQGRYKEAKVYYQQLKGKSYDDGRSWSQVFLEDLETLEKAGVRHTDIKKAKTFLQK